MPAALTSFRQDVISEALQAAVMCSTFPEGKMLEGFADRNDATRVSVSIFRKKDIEKYVTALDKDNGWTKIGDRMVFDNDNIPEHLRPVSRRDGIVFNQRAGLAPEEIRIATSKCMAPTKKGDESWREQYRQDGEAMSRTELIIQDLDADSAMRQHLLCGRPLDEAVRTPSWIREQFRTSCIAAGVAPTLNVDYPFDYNDTRETLTAGWSSHMGKDHRNTISSCASEIREMYGVRRSVRNKQDENDGAAPEEPPQKRGRLLADPLERALMEAQRK
jgi:hypothetical protein